MKSKIDSSHVLYNIDADELTPTDREREVGISSVCAARQHLGLTTATQGDARL